MQGRSVCCVTCAYHSDRSYSSLRKARHPIAYAALSYVRRGYFVGIQGMVNHTRTDVSEVGVGLYSNMRLAPHNNAMLSLNPMGLKQEVVCSLNVHDIAIWTRDNRQTR